MDSRLVHSSQFIVHSKTKTVNRELITRNQKGFTLIELIVGFSIVGITSVLIASIYIAHSRLFSNQSALIDVASQNRQGLDEMTNQIRESLSIADTCGLCTPDTISSTILILQLWPIDSSNEPFEPSPDYDFIIYKRGSTDTSKLIKKIIPGAGSFRTSSERIIATDISDLQFSYDNPDPTQASEVTASLTTTATSDTKTFTNTQATKAVLRNK